MEKPTALQKAHWDAQRSHRELEREFDNKRDKLLDDFREKVDADLEAEYGARLAALRQAELDAERAVEDERIANAKPPHPVGTVMIGWSNKSGSWARESDWQPVAKGIIEIVTRETVHPANTEYSRASLGDVVVRLLKKDGTPSAKYQTLGGWRSHRWLPEGKTPPKDKKRRRR